MTSGIYSALSGMKAKQIELETVAHNLANAATNGFKEEQVSFAAVLGRNGAAGGQRTPYAALGTQQRNFSPGALEDTANPLDLAIGGNAFFELQGSDGSATYTRNGSFALNAQGELVAGHGERVMGVAGPLNLQGGEVQIATDGSVSVGGESRGRIKLVEFENPQKLLARGSTQFQAAEDAGGVESKESTVVQGRVEASNSSMVTNLVKLIEISRQYQTYQQVLAAQGKLDEQAASSLARIG